MLHISLLSSLERLVSYFSFKAVLFMNLLEYIYTVM